MHGLTSSSADFVNRGPERSLAYILADAGYDVWLANAHGNTFLRNHTTLDPVMDAEKFYDFTWHEIRYYIIGAIDYILNLSGDNSLYYIGNSQGTTAFLVLASSRPEFNAKIRIASLMAPAAILQHYPSIFIQTLCKYIDQVELILKKWKIYEILYVKEIRDGVSALCTDPNSSHICDVLYDLLLSGDGG
ncbi:hypothetical protein BDFB_012825 [Asbolus verrucosus]|uniref:AB hydrolase-1 domain-containing protein n=1 Tax=Asbolus verrucosus TaxID=1661398 RepID=A0A482V7F8_ASBVE|nr:hypothetical protein BDFB_012825 [Asbolus verrucosus]